MMRTRTIAALCGLALLSACGEAEVATAPDAPRTVRTIVAAPAEPTRTRSFPAVLEPPEITPLAFDVGGRLGGLDLRIGQRVRAGEVIATVEAADAELRLAQAEAQLREARVAAANARAESDRQETLFERNVASEAARDAAVTVAEQAEARVAQAERNVELVRETVADTALRSPVDAVVNSIEVQAFGTVRAGEPVATLYRDEGLQATVLVSYDVVSALALGMDVAVRPSDGAPDPLAATVTEIARRAPAVSSFPVVVTLAEARDDLRSGMAVEVMVELPVPSAERGVPLPLSALALQRPADMEAMPRRADVFVVRRDGDAATVRPRTVAIGAVIGDRAFVVDGVEPGERVVTAGVPFLHPGQVVALRVGAEPAPDRPAPSPDTPSAEPPPVVADVAPNDVSLADGNDTDVTAITVPLRAPNEGLATVDIPTNDGRFERSLPDDATSQMELDGNARGVPLDEGVDAGDEAFDAIDPVETGSVEPLPTDEGTASGTEAARIGPSDLPLATSTIQVALNALGYGAGPVDGAMGPRTRAAIEAFQRDEGLEPTGTPDTALAAALRTAREGVER